MELLSYVRSVNVKDVWFDSYDEEGTLRSLAWTWTHLAALAR